MGASRVNAKKKAKKRAHRGRRAAQAEASRSQKEGGRSNTTNSAPQAGRAR
jgi:hypothetical protein